jgi:hypothetical protein
VVTKGGWLLEREEQLTSAFALSSSSTTLGRFFSVAANSGHVPSVLCDVISGAAEFMVSLGCGPAHKEPSVLCGITSGVTEFMVTLGCGPTNSGHVPSVFARNLRWQR